jgi:hypothetical protein
MGRGYGISVISWLFLLTLGLVIMSNCVVPSSQLDERFAHSHSGVITLSQFRAGYGKRVWYLSEFLVILFDLGLESNVQWCHFKAPIRREVCTFLFLSNHLISVFRQGMVSQ